ncbi:MAG: phosphatidylinositol phosphate synthase [Mycobacteriales bacterium]|nr:CDP-alcohol phosphatidyltransferase family protein [Frankia sp.]
MLNRVREPIGVAVAPIVRALARTPFSANGLTITGAIGTYVGAFLLAAGQLFWGTMVTTLFVLFDLVDGRLARARGTTGPWGALLDSTLDRLSDAAIFAALVVWFSGDGDEPWLAGLALFCLAAGAVVPYVKARAEGLGLRCDVGFAERAERLIIALVGTGLYGLGVPYVLPVALWGLAVASVVTIGQRLVTAHRQIVGVSA